MITRDAAIEVARKRATELGWAFTEPLDIVVRQRWFGGVDRYEITTNAGMLGTKARFVINATTGKIRDEGYISR
jgi:hypothetical protein